MRKIRKDDEVIVLAGRDRGKRGAVLSVLADGRLLVAGINTIKKHVRPNPQTGEQGGIVSREAPIQRSNVAIFNEETGKADRVGIREQDGKRVRVYKSTDKVIGE